jgi:hypothetical protein
MNFWKFMYNELEKVNIAFLRLHVAFCTVLQAPEAFMVVFQCRTSVFRRAHSNCFSWVVA